MKGNTNPQPIKVEADIPQTGNKQLIYNGFFDHVNTKPKGEYVQVFITDWNTDYWAFYAYISKDTYEEDIDAIWKLIDTLNFRDGDVYIELINHSEGLENFYKYLYQVGKYTHQHIFNKDYWEILQEKGDRHFLYFNKVNGSNDIDDLRNSEYMVFEDWYEALETLHYELYKALEVSNALSCFDIAHFYYGTPLFRMDDGTIVEELF